MRVLIVTWGSRGDCQPYLALAAAFQQAGHEVRLAAPPNAQFSELAAAHGVAFVPLGPDSGQEVLRGTANQAISADDPGVSVRLIIDRLLVPALRDMYSTCLELARWSDVVVSHCVQIVGAAAAEAAGRPCVTGALVPTQILPVRKRHGRFPKLWPRSDVPSWSEIAAYKNSVWLPPINETRRMAGLSSLQDLTTGGFYSSGLNLVAVSPTVFRRPGDWAPEHRLTGYWLLDTPERWAPSSQVIRFLEEDGPTIAIGFGSMTSEDSPALTKLVAEAARQAGVRAIIEPGMAGLGAADMPPEILVASDVPHAWLLPRVAALVHHGGVGTTASALHAGIPSVVVPHVFDQFFWAERARKLGVAPAPISLKSLTAASLSAAIRKAVEDRKLLERARRLGEILKHERGPEGAVQLVEDYASNCRRAEMPTRI
ncbi:MAG: glycosyltransferase [Dehalococcoidia bacterium]|nr:glycosyltransferase [Dehalococcoidia bacterium]